MADEPRIPHHRFYAKQNHVQLARMDKDKSLIRASGIARIDGISTPPITGTSPVLTALVGGELLSANVTWGGPYTGTGAVTVVKQMQRNGASWTAYVGATVVLPSETWQVRELASDTVTTDQPFTSAQQVVAASPPITGTSPVLAVLVAGETLADNVTWGSYSGTGAIGVTRQQQQNSGTWVAYNGASAMITGATWRIRELVSDDLIDNQEFLSSSRVVSAAPPPDPELAVIAFLAGTPGFYFAADKLNTLFQDATGTVPVTADGEPIGRINCLGGTLVGPSFGNSTVAAHPLYAAPDSAEGDGVDDNLNGPTSLFGSATFLEFFVCFDAEVLESNSGALWALGFGGGTSRATVSVNTLGQLQLSVSRATIPLSAAVMLPGQRKVISAYADWRTEGRYELRVDGVIVASSLEGPIQPPIDQNTNRHRILGSTANTPNCVKSKMGRFMFSTKLPSAAERQDIEAWVGELL